jgi:hypothetical protein
MSNFDYWDEQVVQNPFQGVTTWYFNPLALKSSPDYVYQEQLQSILEFIQPMSNFGFVMLWEVTSASKIKNTNNLDYIQRAKLNLQGTRDLAADSTGPPPNPDFPTISSTMALACNSSDRGL